MSPPEQELVPSLQAILFFVGERQAKHHETVKADKYVHFEIMG